MIVLHETTTVTFVFSEVMSPVPQKSLKCRQKRYIVLHHPWINAIIYCTSRVIGRSTVWLYYTKPLLRHSSFRINQSCVDFGHPVFLEGVSRTGERQSTPVTVDCRKRVPFRFRDSISFLDFFWVFVRAPFLYEVGFIPTQDRDGSKTKKKSTIEREIRRGHFFHNLLSVGLGSIFAYTHVSLFVPLGDKQWHMMFILPSFFLFMIVDKARVKGNTWIGVSVLWETES